jgi:hypothetical protein
MPTFKKNPDAEPAFYLKSGNSPLFKMMGSSSPAKKISLEGLKKGFKKLQTKVKDWKADPKNKEKLETIKTAGDALSAAGESLASSSATIAEPVVMDRPTTSPQSTVAPDVTKLIASKEYKLQPPPEGPEGPIVKRSPTKIYDAKSPFIMKSAFKQWDESGMVPRGLQGQMGQGPQSTRGFHVGGMTPRSGGPSVSFSRGGMMPRNLNQPPRRTR